MLIDANLLLYSVHERAEQHATAADWLTEQLNLNQA
jgi:predicted nucleic acid-binding protein